MSTSVNQSGPRGASIGLPVARPRLTVVPRVVSGAPRMPFVLLVVTVLAAGLVGLLLLNTSMERGAYQVTALRHESAALAIEQQSLQLQVAALNDPQELAEKALRLGMVSNPSPAFLSLVTGDVVGSPARGAAGNRLDIGIGTGPGVVRLAKFAPVVGGQASGAATPLVTYRPPRPPSEHPTKGGDTVLGSPGSRQ